MLNALKIISSTDDALLIAQSDVVARIAKAELEKLEALGKTRRYPKGEFVFRAGDPGQSIYFLRKGRIKIYQPSPMGREVILWFCFAGEIFGLSEIGRSGGRIVNAQICENSEVLCVPYEAFKVFLANHPDTALLIMQVLSCRLRALGDVLVNLVTDDVNTRIAKLILRLGANYGTRNGKHIFLSIHLTHQEIADMVGTTRQTVTSVLGRLKRDGILSIDNQRIHIESEELLSEMTHASVTS